MNKNIISIGFLVILSFFIPVYADQLKNISLDYCYTTGNVLHYTLDPQTQTGICYIVSNSSEEDVSMKINFVDGTFTNDQRQNRACLDDAAQENFGKYIFSYQKIITLSGGEQKKMFAQMQYPKASDGQYHGCITYSVLDTTTKDSTGEVSNFSILMRKAKFIDVLVGHPENSVGGITFKNFTGGKNLSLNSKIRIYQDPGDNKYIIEMTIQNIGSMEQNVVLTGVASNMLTYKYTFSETRKILKGQEFIISKKLDELPNYDMNVDVQMAYTPVITGMPTLTAKTSYIHETAHIFILNIITVATAIGLLIFLIIFIILIKLLFKKKKPIDLITPTIPSAPISTPLPPQPTTPPQPTISSPPIPSQPMQQ